MTTLRYLFLVMLAAATAAQAAAQGPLDIVPRDAAAAVAIRDLDALMKKGDKFLTDTDIRVPLRPSELFNQANQFLGINKGLDRNGSAGIILMNPEKPDGRLGLGDLERLLVPVVPFTDLDAMAGNFGLGKGAMPLNGIVKTESNKPLTKYASRSTKHVYLSDSEATLKRLQKSKPIATSFSNSQREQFGESDILIHLGRYLWANEFDSLREEVARKIKPGDDPSEQAFAKAFGASLKEVQNAAIGFRLDDGIDAHFAAIVPKIGEAAKLLAALRGKRKPSTLQGLPEGNVLFAQASSADSGRHALLAKTFFRFLLEDLLIQRDVVAATDMMNYLGVFQEVWTRLQGNRAAIYQNSNETKVGLFTAIAILDSDDPQGFLREMRTLARMAVADTLDFSKQEVKDEIDFGKLVKELASSAYRTRQSAATRLALIGEPSLAHLQKAIDSNLLDIETLRRAQELRQRINAVAAARRKELLTEKNQPLFLRPKLTFVSSAEKRHGVSIDAIQVAIAGLTADARKQYAQLLGPDWDKIRVAVLDKQIVVMVGSDVSLFDAAVRHIQKGSAGLAEAKNLAGFHRQAAKDRLFEFHVSVEGILRLVAPKAQLGTTPQLTSAALALGETFLQVDARVPTAEIRAIARKAQEGMR